MSCTKGAHFQVLRLEAERVDQLDNLLGLLLDFWVVHCPNDIFYPRFLSRYRFQSCAKIFQQQNLSRAYTTHPCQPVTLQTQQQFATTLRRHP